MIAIFAKTKGSSPNDPNELNNVCIQGDGLKTDLDICHEVDWLLKVEEFTDADNLAEKLTNVSWKAFHAGQAQQVRQEIVRSQILPVFTEASNTLAMVRHCITVILRAHLFTNPGETPWVTADQPLFALFQKLQPLVSRNLVCTVHIFHKVVTSTLSLHAYYLSCFVKHTRAT